MPLKVNPLVAEMPMSLPFVLTFSTTLLAIPVAIAEAIIKQKVANLEAAPLASLHHFIGLQWDGDQQHTIEIVRLIRALSGLKFQRLITAPAKAKNAVIIPMQ